MELVLLIGIQASGKSTFCGRRFFHTHLRVSLDMLRTRYREKRLFEQGLALGLPMVVDNTNPTIADRARYLRSAREAGYRVCGYYFHSKTSDCILRNAAREGRARIPDKGILGTAARLELPAYEEGFDELHHVRIGDEGEFCVSDWKI